MGVQAAEYNYVPLVREGVQWTYVYEFMYEWFRFTPRIDTYTIGAETEVDGVVYRQVMLNDEQDAVALIREEDKKVYVKRNDLTEIMEWPLNYDEERDEYLIYDFNKPGAGIIDAEEGKEIMIGGTTRMSYGNDRLIEGIGLIEDYSVFCVVRMPMPEDGSMYNLAKVTENGETVYKTFFYRNYERIVQTGYSIYFGDMNHDKVVNSADISKYYEQLIGNGSYDMNGDGEVNSADVSTLYEVIIK